MNSYHGKGPAQQRILRLLADGKPRTCREIAIELDMAPVNAANRVMSMYHFGFTPAEELVTVVGVGALKARTYTITDLGRKLLT